MATRALPAEIAQRNRRGWPRARKKPNVFADEPAGPAAGPADAAPPQGWFRNPFAKSAGHGKVGPAARWAGHRRGVLIRRILMVLAVALLVLLVARVGNKVDKEDLNVRIQERIDSSVVGFPRGAAALWAAPLFKTFATYDAALAQQRAAALRPYITSGLDAQLGWNGQGKQVVIDMVVSPDVEALDDRRGVVRATVQIQDGSWRCIAAPVYLEQRDSLIGVAFALTGSPVYQPCSGVVAPPEAPTIQSANDTALAAEFTDRLLPPFMAAWAQGDQANLARYLLPGRQAFGLAGAFTGAGEGNRPQISAVYVPTPAPGENPDARTITFTTTFLAPDGQASQTSTYQVRVSRTGGQWYFEGDPSPAVSIPGVGGGQPAGGQPTSGPNGSKGNLFPTPSGVPYPSTSAGPPR